MTQSPVEDAYALVYGVLGGRPHESLTAAARRVLTTDMRMPLEALEVARRVVAMTGTPPADQWRALMDCAALIRRHDARKQRRHGRHVCRTKPPTES